MASQNSETGGDGPAAVGGDSTRIAPERSSETVGAGGGSADNDGAAHTTAGSDAPTAPTGSGDDLPLPDEALELFGEDGEERERETSDEDEAGFQMQDFRPGLTNMDNREAQIVCKRILLKDFHERDDDDIQQLMDLTESVRFFKNLNVSMRRELCRVMTHDEMSAGDHVFDQGDEGTTFYVILSGSVDVNVRDARSATSFTATRLFLGDSFGELALVNSAPRGATIVCCEDCSFLRIEKSDYERILKVMHDMELEERAEFLSSIPIFHTWTKHYLTQLAQIMAPKSVPRNKVIIRQGDEPDGLYFIKHGECKVVMQLAFRRRKAREAPRLTAGRRAGKSSSTASIGAETTTTTPVASRETSHSNVGGGSPAGAASGSSNNNNNNNNSPAAATPQGSQASTTTNNNNPGEEPIMKLLEVGTIGPREYFGELALIEMGTLRAASVVSTTPVDLLVLSKNDFARRIAPTKKTFDLLVEASTRYASPQDLRDAYFKQKRWEQYKKTLVSNIVTDKNKRRALKYR